MPLKKILPLNWVFQKASHCSLLIIFTHMFIKGAFIGFKSLSVKHIKKAGLKRAIGFIIQPIENWSRYPELLSVLEFFPILQQNDIVLDIGSPKCFGLCIANSSPARFILTDIWDIAIREVEEIQQQFIKNNQTNVHLCCADALNLSSYNDKSINVLYSISVIEHIATFDGFERALQEFARILKPNGVCLITVPIHKIFKEEYSDEKVYSDAQQIGQKNFFSYFYDLSRINKIIFQAKEYGLELEHLRILYWKESWILLKIWRKFPQKLRGFLGFINLLFAPWSFITQEHLPNSSFSGAGDIVLCWRKKVEL